MSVSQLTMLVAGLILSGGLLALVVYGVHKAFRRGRQEGDFAPRPPSPKDDASVIMATLQALIARMKAQEKELRERLRAAEQRAEEGGRIVEVLIREMPCALIVLDGKGFVTRTSPGVRALLGIDPWSRRRYSEILDPQSALAGCIRECLATGKSYQQETIEYRNPKGELRLLGMSLMPLQTRNGEISGALCLLTERTEAEGRDVQLMM